MHIRFFASEYERTCQECGYSWQVPRSIARRGIRGISAMTVMGATRERGFGQPGGPDLTNLTTAIGGCAEAMEGYRICAKCGVDNFTQRPVRGS
jgi:predicted nucleic-acid-binding Zn-ribbon protein